MLRTSFFVFLALLAGAYCEERALSRDKRFAVAYAGGFPFNFGPFARPSFPFSSPVSSYSSPVSSYASPWEYPRNYVPFPWSYFPFPVINFPQNWYEGSNVCKKVKIFNPEAPDELTKFLNSEEFSNSDTTFSHQEERCEGKNGKYGCIKKVFDDQGNAKVQFTSYECCHGFVRDPSGSGCVEIDLKNILPTLRNMGGTKFANIAERAGMSDALHTRNYTVFCPLNSALESAMKEWKIQTNNEVLTKPSRQKSKKKKRMHNMITEHLVPGFYKVDDLRDGQVIDSENQNSQIRMNVYYIPEMLVTANCVPLVSGNHFARNGIIHVVEKLLPKPTRTVADIIAGDAQFSTLKKMLSKAGLVQTLRNPNKTFTVFAPTDSAFPKSELEHEDDSKEKCAVSVMKHHIIDHVICASAIPEYAKSLNLIGELLSLSRDEHNKLYVDGVQIVVRDLVATNGVVHVIDGVLKTKQAKTPSEILREYGLSEFLSLLEIANLKRMYDTFENATFFIPSNEAIQAIPPTLLNSLTTNIDSLFSILLYHVAEGISEINAPEVLLTSKLENTTLKVQIHTSFPHNAPQTFVQCGVILSPSNKICGGRLHVINKMLLPPKLSILEILETLEEFSTLVLLLKTTGLERRLARSDVSHTLLAPADDAFHQMGRDALFKLLEDRPLAMDLLKMHTIQGTVCCSQLKDDLLSGRPQVRALDGSILTLNRQVEGSVRIGGARIVDCDIMASNGVIHMVDSIVRQEDVTTRTGVLNTRLIRI